MKIRIEAADVKHIKFAVTQTSDRQSQPTDLADQQKWPHALWTTTTWQCYRWDMFYVDVSLSLEDDLSPGVISDGKFLLGSRTRLAVACFFIRPEFQNPAVPVMEKQPSCLDEDSAKTVKKLAQRWFVRQPEFKQMEDWGWSAMKAMRDVLVLADKFDVDWWEVFEKNAEMRRK